MSTIAHARPRSYALAALAGMIAIALSLGSVRILSQDDSGTAAVDPASPAWFGPVADYYGHNPKVTPTFQFANLYTAKADWFGPIAEHYHFNPAITPTFDFAALYGPTGSLAGASGPQRPAAGPWYTPRELAALTAYANASFAEKQALLAGGNTAGR